jgi:hypothetical protein
LISGDFSASFTATLSLSMISLGVPTGADMPFHVLASKPGRKSLTDGRSGSAAERCLVVTANGRSLPALM